MFLGIFLGRIVVYQLRSHSSSVSKFWGGQCNKVRSWFCVVCVYKARRHCNRFVVMVFMYALLWLKIRVL